MKKIKLISLVTLLGVGLTSCEKYLDVNFDPSFPQVSQGFALLPPMLGQMARASGWT